MEFTLDRFDELIAQMQRSVSAAPRDFARFQKEHEAALAEMTRALNQMRTMNVSQADAIVRAAMMATALEESQAKLLDEITERKRAEAALAERARLSALSADVGVALTRGGSLNEILQSCAEALMKHLDAAFARVWTLNEAANVLELRASAGMYTHLDGPHSRIPVGWFKIGLIARDRQPIVTNTVIGDPRFTDQEWAQREGMTSFAGNPLILADRLLGVMALFSRQALSEATLSALEAVSGGIALGIQRKLAESALRQAKEDAESANRSLAETNLELQRQIQARERLMDVLWASENRTRQIIETANDAFIGMDAQGRITDWNQQAEKLFGWPRALAIGRILADTIVPAELRPAHVAGLERYLKTNTSNLLYRRLEIQALRRNSQQFPVELTVWPLHEGPAIRFYAFVRDITARKQAEEAQRQAKEAAEAASRAKSEFLANMSHEIRTPMNGILGMTELALDTELTRTQREYLEMVKRSADSLLTVINDILDFSKIEAGKLSLDEVSFSLRDCLGDAMKTLALRAHAKGLELTYHVEPNVPQYLRGDPGRLRQVIINLVGNAIKFTEQGEVAVHVGLDCHENHDVRLLFAVRDTGIGIPHDKQQAVFNAFEQADSSTTRRYGGTGLGLAISSQLISLMHGKITLHSEVGKGSTFAFDARFGLAEAPRKLPSLPRKLHGLRVLVVDDNATNRIILRDILKGWHMEPTIIENGPDALHAMKQAFLEHNPFDLVLLDAMMPHMDGFTVAAQLKANATYARATLMMLSSADRSEDAHRCQQLGLAGYVTKPITQSDLFDAIVMALRISLERELAQPAEPALNHLPPLRILLAEDNPVNQLLAQRILEKQGHAVVVAENGARALELLDQDAIDLVLMDVQMPEISGFEATARIRAREQATGRHLPIIAMTAHAMAGDRERCLQAGMDGYVAKPIDARALLQAIAGAFQAASAPAETAAAPSTKTTCFDRQAALARVDGDADFLKVLVHAFLDDCPRRLADIRAAVRDQDASKLQAVAHALKGSVGNFNAQPTVDAALTLETLGESGDLSGAVEAVAELERQLNRLLPALAELA